MKQPLIIFLLFVAYYSQAQEYPVKSTVLKNGLKVIACEKPGNQFAQVEVWYRVGSKDEKPGIRGMAHLFEHMMFRGTKKYPGNAVFENVDSVGGSSNAYTSFDRTVYHQYVPVTALDMVLDMEADRMANLKVDQNLLNTERQVVGEELRIGENNWFGKLYSDRYPFLYPEGHPYEVDVIGYLSEITNFTAEQCMEFYNNYYSPNNAYLIVVGNVKAEQVFTAAEKYFGPITKQLDIKKQQQVPDIFISKIRTTELPIELPLQIYSYVYPKPEAGSKDHIGMLMLTDLLFLDENSILQNRLVKKDYSAYGIINSNDPYSLYPSLGSIDIIMGVMPGNVRVKKAVREEINKVITEGIPQEMIDRYVKAIKAQELMENYYAQNIAANLGIAEYYFNDYSKADKLSEEFKKITPEDLKNLAAKYFAEDKMQVINIKPAY